MSAYIRSKVSNNQSTDVSIEAENSSAKLRKDGSFKLPNASDASLDSPSGSIRYNDATDKLEFKNPVGWKSVDAYSDEEIVSEAELAVVLNNMPTVAKTGRYQDLLEIPADIATQTYVSNAIAALVDSAPDTLNTLNEIAQAINNNEQFGQTIFGLLDTKLNLQGGIMQGELILARNPEYPLGAATKQYVDSVAAGVAALNTDNITEGTVNLYYADSRARQSVSGGIGVSVDSSTGVISIGQPVNTTSNVTFNDITANKFISTATGVPTISSATNIVLDAAGTVILNSPLILKKYTTSELAGLVADEGTMVFDSTDRRIKIYNQATWDPISETIDGGTY